MSRGVILPEIIGAKVPRYAKRLHLRISRDERQGLDLGLRRRADGRTGRNVATVND